MCTTVLSDRAKQSLWHEALKILAEMQAQGLERNVITYSAAISACEKGYQWQQALELLAEMQAQGLETNVITYNAAISPCEKGSQWHEALKLLAEMQPWVASWVISRLAASSAADL